MKTVELDVEVKHKTEKAWLCYDGKQEVWIPVSAIDDYCEEGGKVTSIFITEWMAKEKGLI